MILNNIILGTIYSYERFIYEKRSRFCFGLLNHCTINIQRPDGSERSDSSRKRHRRCKKTI